MGFATAHESFQADQAGASVSADFAQHGDIDKAAEAAAYDEVLGRAELHERKAVIAVTYEIRNGELWGNNGKRFEEIINPDDARRVENFDRLHPEMLSQLRNMQSTMVADDSVMQSFVVSPDIGFGRSYVYCYQRDSENPSKIHLLAIEAPAGPEELGRFVKELTGDNRTIDIGDGRIMYHQAFCKAGKEVTQSQILSAARNSFDGEAGRARPDAADYLTRVHDYFNNDKKIVAEQQARIQQVKREILAALDGHDAVKTGALLRDVVTKRGQDLNRSIHGLGDLARGLHREERPLEPQQRQHLKAEVPQHPPRFVIKEAAFAAPFSWRNIEVSGWSNMAAKSVQKSAAAANPVSALPFLIPGQARERGTGFHFSKMSGDLQFSHQNRGDRLKV